MINQRRIKKTTELTQEILNQRFSLLRTSLAIGIGLLLSAVIILLVSDDPMLSMKYLLIGPLMTLNNFYSTIAMWVPIAITGLAVCIMFSANQFNLFVEGAFFFGGAVAAMAALTFDLPGGILPVVCILCAALVCALLSAIPALMRAKLGASEMVASIMLNYACAQLGLFLISTFFRDTSAGSVVSGKIPAAAHLDEFLSGSRINISFVVAIILTVLAYYLMYRTRWGYEIRLTGQNKNFAQKIGVNIGFVTVFSQMIGGALAGTAGAMEMLGLYSRFSWSGLTGHGWDGITLGILANRNPKYIPLAALFLAYLRKGADLMSMKTGMQTDFISIIQAVILIFLLAERFLAKYKQKKVYELSKKMESGHAAGGGLEVG